MATLEKPKILIVDDLEVNLILLETVLRKEPTEIFKATSGEMALGIAKMHDFALFILDVSMPGMNGFELAEKLRNLDNNRHTPIIFITAILYDQQSVSRGYQAGAVDYLTKPYQNDILISKVRIFLRIHQQNRELQTQSKALNESLARYRKAEQTILFKYQVERATALASARFSGNFDASSSIEFMLRDLIRLCNARSAGFVMFDDKKQTLALENGEGSGKLQVPDDAQISRMHEAFLQYSEGCRILFNTCGFDGDWFEPGSAQEFASGTEPCAAIVVNTGEKPAGALLLEGCRELLGWEKPDICALGVFGTITGNAIERSMTRAALQASEAKYRSYLENAPVGILVVHSSGVIDEVNPAALRIFIAGEGSLHGMPLEQLFSHDNLAGNFPGYNGMLTSGGAIAEFFTGTGKAIRIVRAESSRLPDGRFLIFCTDITTAREMEKHLIHTERMVGIGEMATGIAHEINQPLNTISFGIDNLMHALENGKADGEYIREKSRKIFEGIHRMRTIIDHVRTFSRANDDYVHARFSVNESIINALSLVSEQFSNHGITIKTVLAPDPDVSAFGNTYKIEQVILNLLSNAKDATGEKKQSVKGDYIPQIEISSEVKDSLARIHVKDNGSGIGPEHLEHITAPFYTTKEPGKGTGLGLAISYGIMKEHNGTITFSSEPGQWTCVTLELPLAGNRQTGKNEKHKK